METLRKLLDDPQTGGGKVFALIIQFLILLSLVTFSIETLPNLTDRVRKTLYNVEVITVIIFTAEYFLRFVAAENKFKFVTSFFGIVDLLAILPFYVTTGVDLRAIRIVRLVRLVRIFKIMRYNDALKRFHRAFIISKEELVLFGSCGLVILFLAAVDIYYFENEAQPEKFASVFHSLWWAVATLTSLGYGDVYPITLGGRIFTFVVLVLGLGVVAVPTGLIASALPPNRTQVLDRAPMTPYQIGDYGQPDQK